MIHIRTHSHWYDLRTAVYYNLDDAFPYFIWLAAVLPTWSEAIPRSLSE
jgi:hypothetical protein